MSFGYHTTRNLNVAVALGTCGVHVEIEKMLDTVSGRYLETFKLASSNVPNPEDYTKAQQAEDGAAWEDEASAGGMILRGPLQFSTGLILDGLRKRTLEKADPAHPVLDVLAGLNIRECLLTYMKRGERYRVALVNGAARATLIPGQEPMAQRLGQADFKFIRTDDLGIASALVRVGVPVLDVVGAAPNRMLVMARYGYALPGTKPVDGLMLAEAMTSGKLADYIPEHPALWVMMGIQNRSAMLDRLKHERTLLWLRRPKSLAWRKHHRCALVREGDKPAAFDKAHKFLTQRDPDYVE